MFILYLAVKEFWKSVKIWESYWQKFGGFLFGGHGVKVENARGNASENWHANSWIFLQRSLRRHLLLPVTWRGHARVMSPALRVQARDNVAVNASDLTPQCKSMRSTTLHGEWPLIVTVMNVDWMPSVAPARRRLQSGMAPVWSSAVRCCPVTN